LIDEEGNEEGVRNGKTEASSGAPATEFNIRRPFVNIFLGAESRISGSRGSGVEKRKFEAR